MALEFDGSSQYVEIADALSLRLSGQCFLSTWVCVDAFPTSGNCISFIVKKYDGTTIGYYLDVYNSSGTLQLRVGSYQSTDKNTTWNITGWNTGEWHWIAGGYDGSNWNVYFDGERKNQSVNATGAISTSLPVNLGCTNLNSTYARYLNGRLFDSRIYNQYPSANEIAEIYHKRGADRVWEGLVGWWKLDEAPSGTPAPLLLDSMDSTSGWTASSGAVSLNTTTKQEGIGSISLSKTDTSYDYCYMYKSISSTNLTGQTLKVWVYIKDSATLAKINDLKLWFGQNSLNRYMYIYTDSLSVGWNAISVHVDDFSVYNGSPTKTDVQILYFTIATINVTDTLSADDVLFDFYRAGDYVPNSIIDLSGNGNHGTLYGGTFQASPHRLRRGVLVS